MGVKQEMERALTKKGLFDFRRNFSETDFGLFGCVFFVVGRFSLFEQRRDVFQTEWKILSIKACQMEMELTALLGGRVCWSC